MRTTAALITLAVLAQPLAAQTLRPTKNDLQEINTTQFYFAYPEGQIEAVEQDLKQALRKQSPNAAAHALANKYGFAEPDMERFIAAWIIAHSRRFDNDKSWVSPVRAELYALVPKFRATPLGLALLAEVLDMPGDECPAENFDALMQGSTAPAEDGYVIASTAGCVGNFLRAALVARDRNLPSLIRLAQWGGLPPRDVLPLYAWLTSPTALSHVRDTDRMVLATILWRRYLTALFEADMSARALALFDALPSELRTAVIAPAPRPRSTVLVDGIAMTFKGERQDGQSEVVGSDLLDHVADALSAEAEALERKKSKTSALSTSAESAPAPADTVDYSSIEAPILEISEAMALAGRDGDARQLLATLPGLGEARAALDCEFARAGNSKAECPNTQHLPMGALPLDHLLNRANEDPYPIAEVTLSGSSIMGRSASGAILCRVFPKADFPGICPDAPDDSYFAQTDTKPAELKEVDAALERMIPDFKALRATILGVHDLPAQPHERLSTRASVIAVPPNFEEKAITAGGQGTSVPVTIKSLAPLPDGFQLVRAEREGRRVVAISVSQTYDPTGEVSQGGYWVHVSRDSGKHWGRPLYTGLADRFPYVVLSASHLPLVAGDHLQLAVDVAELDTASITYPPVALRTRRTAKGRYLTIPLAALEQDSDGDGLTDITAHHLLLDRPRTAGSTPFVLGSDYDADCRATPSAEKLALIDLLGRMSGESGAAIVEPVDRPAKQLMGGWRRAASTVDRPQFLIGRAGDFSCLSSRRLIIVYGEADIEAIRHFTPDFHALEMPPILFNRARDRGYVRWSTGWAGGTYRLRRIDGKWEFDSISNWIT